MAIYSDVHIRFIIEKVSFLGAQNNAAYTWRELQG